MIEISQVNIEYDRVIIDNGSISIPSGKITLLKGESGIGKTALLYRIALMSDEQSFCFQYNHKDIKTLEDREKFRKDNISFVLQDIVFFPHFTVLQTMQYFAELSQQQLDENKIKAMLNQVSLDVGLDQNIMTLSLGERQRLSIVCSLMKNPTLLILDEPTASLDYENEIIIFEILKELAKNGVHVCLASHSQEAEKYADVIYTIQDKQIITKKNAEEGNNIVLNNQLIISHSFLKKYAKNYLSSYQFLYSFLIMTFILSFLSCSIFNVFVNASKENALTVLKNQFDNKLIITQDDSQFIDQEYINYMTVNDIKQAYPLYQMNTEIKDDTISIIPYFESDTFDKYIGIHLSNDKKGIYMDYDTYQKYVTLENKTFSIHIYDKGKSYTVKKDLTINGVMIENYEQHYTTQSQKFIFMPYDMMKNIYEQFPVSYQYPAYVILYNHFNDLVSHKELLIKEGYHINDSFTDIQSIDAIINYYICLQILGTIMIIGVTLIIDIVLMAHIHTQKRKENMLLRLTGLSTKNIIEIEVYEYLFEIGIVFMIGIIASIVITMLSIGMSIDIFIILGLITVIYLIVFFIERILFMNREVHKYTIEKVLRKSESD